MLYNDGQLLTFLLSFVFGIGVYIIRILLNLSLRKINNKVVLGFKDALYMLILFLGLIIAVVAFNYGVLRFYVVVAYFTGMYLTYKIYKLLLAKFSTKLYNLNDIK